jgi:peroxiredoxin
VKRSIFALCVFAVLNLFLACNSGQTPSPATATASSAALPSPSAALAAEPAALPKAELGKPAPELSLPDTAGKMVKLSDHRGKLVVLEWFNPDCPFVRAAHTKGPLVGMAKKQTDAGVVWLAINSSAPGRQGHGADKNAAGAKGFGMTHPVLLDESGRVGRAFGATNTPHMFVVDDKGVLVYRGAIDNSPDGESQSPEGDKLINHVEVALADLRAGRPVSLKETKAYGCGVKYAPLGP